MDFEKNIKHIETVIGYTFKDKSLLKQAFTRTSFCNEHKGRCGARYQSNEVLEFFGDSILSAAIVTLLMKDLAKRYEYGISTSLTEGDFSNIKSKLSDKKNLSLTTKRLELQKFLLMWCPRPYRASPLRDAACAMQAGRSRIRGLKLPRFWRSQQRYCPLRKPAPRAGCRAYCPYPLT